MAKKKLQNLEYVKPSYYAYYDGKTGKILSVTNEKSNDYEFGIEISDDDANKLISGEWSFSDYLIGFQKQSNGTTIKCVIPNTDQEYAFRHNLFEWVVEKDIEEEFFVEWNLVDKEWRFGIRNKNQKEFIQEVTMTRFVFFITLRDDLDFLIRTVFIEKDTLMNTDYISIPFESSKELDIKSISISTRAIFKSYRLYIKYE